MPGLTAAEITRITSLAVTAILTIIGWFATSKYGSVQVEGMKVLRESHDKERDIWKNEKRRIEESREKERQQFNSERGQWRHTMDTTRLETATKFEELWNKAMEERDREIQLLRGERDAQMQLLREERDAQTQLLRDETEKRIKELKEGMAREREGWLREREALVKQKQEIENEQ